MTSPTRIAEIAERLAKATPRPWEASGIRGRCGGIPGHGIYKPDRNVSHEIGIAFVYAPTLREETKDPSSPSECLANRALIAHAPADLSYLLTAHAALTEEVARLRDGLEKIAEFGERRGQSITACMARNALAPKEETK